MRLINHEIKNRDITIVRRMETSLSSIQSDPYQLRQVLLNLLTNAVHAIRSVGTITITIKDVGNGQMVMVSDTGQGIPRENLNKIFEPFFSTKPPGEGTGLGLFVTRGIIEKLGGTIEVESKVGLGTSVCIRLPKHQKHSDDVDENPTQNWVEKIKSRFAE